MKTVFHRSPFASGHFTYETHQANALSESQDLAFELRLACNDMCPYNRLNTAGIEIDLDAGGMNCKKSGTDLEND